MPIFENQICWLVIFTCAREPNYMFLYASVLVQFDPSWQRLLLCYHGTLTFAQPSALSIGQGARRLHYPDLPSALSLLAVCIIIKTRDACFQM